MTSNEHGHSLSAIISGLRPYQMNAIDSARKELLAGHKAIVFVSPTGSGKTVIMAHLIARALAKGKRCDFLSHRRELNRQCAAKLIECGVPLSSICVLGGGKVIGDINAPVHIGSVQTIHHRGARVSDLLFVDEAHRSMARQHRDLIGQYLEKGARVLGFTATPARLDGASLGDVYQKMVIIATPKELLEQGFIVNPVIFTVPDKELPDLEKVGTKLGDFGHKELAEAVTRAELVGSITEHWMRRSRKPSICFAVNRAHSRQIVAAFESRGISAIHVDGSSRDKERIDAIAKLRRGEVKIVSQCELWIEGVDIPEVRSAILARPTQSVTVYLQSIGRVERPYLGQGSIVLDHAGNVRRLGLPLDDRPWALGPGKVRALSLLKAKACPDCYLVMANGEETCPECGYVFGQPGEERPVKTKRGELVLLKEQEVWNKRHEHWTKIWNRGWDHKDAPEYVRNAFIKRFKVEPKAKWVPPERPNGKEEELAWIQRMGAKAFYSKISWSEIDKMFENRFGHKRI